MGDVAEDGSGSNGFTIQSSAVDTALNHDLAAISSNERGLDLIDLFSRYHTVKHVHTVIQAIRMDDIEHQEVANLFLAIPESFLPGPVDIYKTTIQCNALDHVVSVLKEVPISLFTLPQCSLHPFAPDHDS